MSDQISQSEQLELQNMVSTFPESLNQAVEDWAKFKMAVDYGLVPNNKRRLIVDWFREWPKYWEALKPNYDPQLSTGMISPHRQAVYDKANAFAARLTTEDSSITGLGIAPLIIAGVLIAGALGIGGAFWAIGYYRKQNNISAMIDATITGKLRADILLAAVEKESESLFPDIKGITTWAVVGAAVLFFWPQILSLLNRGQSDA